MRVEKEKDKEMGGDGKEMGDKIKNENKNLKSFSSSLYLIFYYICFLRKIILGF